MAAIVNTDVASANPAKSGGLKLSLLIIFPDSPKTMKENRIAVARIIRNENKCHEVDVDECGKLNKYLAALNAKTR